MIGYVTLGTNDMPRAAKFYDALLAEMNVGRLMGDDTFIAWGTAPETPALSVIKPYDNNPASVGNGTMVALTMKNTDQVDQLYNKAIQLGAQCEGPAGARGESGFYAGYIRDLDGNKLCFFTMVPSS